MNIEAARPSDARGQTRKPRIGIVVISAIPDDPRVRRQGEAFAAAGWDVIGFGLAGGRSAPPAWPIVTPSAPASTPPAGPSSPSRWRWLDPDRNRAARVIAWGYWRLLRPLVHFVARGISLPWRKIIKTTQTPLTPAGITPGDLVRACLLRAAPARADDMYWSRNSVFTDLYKRARLHSVDIWLANDWTAAGLVRRLAREQNVPYGYDAHELAVDEYTEDRRWRLIERPFVVALERRIVDDAAIVTCVSRGISERMAQVHQMAHPPEVIRNVPFHEEYPFRPTGPNIRILYHGILVPGRGLEECIESVALWPDRFTLTIRGPAEETYAAALHALAQKAGVEQRVSFVAAVPMVDLVREAAAFDLGIFVLPLNKLHNIHVLPNKLFEYLMAGLGVIVSNAPEMAEIVEAHDAGVLIETLDPGAIARAIAPLEAAAIDRYKQNALKAARVLNWETESARFVAAYAGKIATRGGFPSGVS